MCYSTAGKISMLFIFQISLVGPISSSSVHRRPIHDHHVHGPARDHVPEAFGREQTQSCPLLRLVLLRRQRLRLSAVEDTWVRASCEAARGWGVRAYRVEGTPYPMGCLQSAPKATYLLAENTVTIKFACLVP